MINIKREYYQGKLVAYMKKNEATLRYKLLKIEKRYLTATLRVKNSYKSVEDVGELNAQIDLLEAMIDQAVTEIFAENPRAKITNKVVEEALLPKVVEEKDEREGQEILLYDFEQYINKINKEKLEEDFERGIERKGKWHPTAKDYVSCRNALLDFEYDTKQMLYLSDVTEDFIEEFIDYLIDERPIPTEEELKNAEAHVYLTKGGLENAIVNKRLDCLATFIRHFYKQEDVATMVSSSRLNSEDLNDVIRIYKDELKALADMPLETEAEKRIRDYFVFICLSGLRFSDLISIRRVNFRQEGDRWRLQLFTRKTIKFADIPLVPRALALARKYNFDFSYYTNQAFNRELKQLLEKYNLYGDSCPKIRRVKKKLVTTEMLRRERISAHCGRRTFISILIEEGTPISRVMGFTGHKKESTLKVYVDKFSPHACEAISPLNI